MLYVFHHNFLNYVKKKTSYFVETTKPSVRIRTSAKRSVACTCQLPKHLLPKSPENPGDIPLFLNTEIIC